MRRPRLTIPGRYLTYAALCIIAILCLLRFVNLDADPPHFFKGFSQADLTDPYHLTFAARNAVLFGDWNLFDNHRWDVFRNSLISGLAYIFFSLAGVSRITANIAALMLNLGGILFFALALRRLRPAREVIVTLLLLLSSAVFFFHSRLPFLENGLIFLSGLSFFVFIRFHDRRWGQILTGFLIALAALTGKLFGFILLGPVALALIYLYRKKSALPMFLVLAGTVAGILAVVLLLYGGSLTVMMNYYTEQTVGMYGVPDAFTSPFAFIESIVNFGAEFGFFELSIFLSILCILGLILMVLTLPIKDAPTDQNLVLVFLAGWFLCGVVGLMPFNYRALRYTLFLFPAIAAIAAYGINLFLDHKVRLRFGIKWLSFPVMFFALWYLFTQLYLLTVPFNTEMASARQALPLTGLGAAAATCALAYFLRDKGRLLPRRLFGGIALILAIGLAYEQGAYLFTGLFRAGHFLDEYNTAITQLIDESAVVTGPYAPALTIDNKLKGVIYVFGLANVEKDLFQKYPITHIVTDDNNWKRALKDFPMLEKASLLRKLIVRDFVISLYRLPDANLPFTDFEMMEKHASSFQIDSALVYGERFATRYPDNLLGQISLVAVYEMAGRQDKFQSTIQTISSNYPNDFRVQLLMRDIYNAYFVRNRDPRYKSMAEECYRKAVALNPSLAPRRR